MKPLVCHFLLVLATTLLAPAALADQHGHAYFIEPTEGAVVSSPIRVVFGLSKNWGVAPAGFDKDNTGHHHLLINTDLPDLSLPIPADDNHRHFGGGQTETEIELPPGQHTLQLLLGNFSHIPHAEPVLSEKITITVE